MEHLEKLIKIKLMKLNKIKEENLLIENKDKALISKKLVTLKQDATK